MTYTKTDPSAIPAELQAIPTWVNWKAVVKPGRSKPIKMPVDSKTGSAAKSSDPGTWGTFQQAVDRMNADPSITGLGFVFTKGCGVVGIDLDGVVDQQGNLSPDVEALLQEFNSFTELSPSGTGLHIFCKATPPPEMTSLKRPNSLTFPVEVFCSGFYLTCTGVVCQQTPPGLNDGQKALDNLLDALEVTPKAKAKNKKAVTSEDAPEGLRSLDDFETNVIPKLAALSPRQRTEHKSPSGMDGWKWTVDCPWKNSHTNGDPEASVFLHEDGRPGFRCLHSHCHDKKWQDLQRDYDLPASGVVAEYNERYAVVNLEGKVRVMTEIIKPGSLFVEEIYSSFEDWGQFHAVERVSVTEPGTGKVTHIPKTKIWLNSPKRRQYNHIVFEPGKTVAKDCYNLFRGWSMKPKQGDWSIFKGHLLDNICDGSEDNFKWLMSWFARIVQDPGGKRPGSCPVLVGGQGTGKTTVGDIFGHLVEPYYLHLSKSEQLVGKFNRHLKAKLFVAADEAFFAGARSEVGRLKTLITDKEITVEPKGIDAYSITNHINLVMCSNNAWVVPAEFDERRFFVLNVNPRRAQDTKFFGEMYDQMEAGGYEAFFYDLLQWDYKQVTLRTVPQTKGLHEQKLASLNSVATYWHDCLCSGKLFRANEELERLEGEVDEWPEEVKKSELYHGYKLHSKVHGSGKYSEQYNVFWRELAKIAPAWHELRHGKGNDTRYVKIGTYDECVEAWEKRFGKIS